MPAIFKVLLRIIILVASNSVMGQDVEQATMESNSNISKRGRHGTRELHYSMWNKKTQNKLANEPFSSKNVKDFNKRAFIISQGQNPRLKYNKGIEKKEAENKSSIGGEGENKAYNLHADIERLQAQIMKTTMEINQLYGSYAGAKNDEIKYNPPFATKMNLAERRKLVKKVTQGVCNEKIGKYCCGSNEVASLRGKLKLERTVRNQMIRILAREKLKNERKTKALEALVRYYRPDLRVLKQLKLPLRLKRVIIAERIKLLSIGKKIEFARRAKQLHEKVQLT